MALFFEQGRWGTAITMTKSNPRKPHATTDSKGDFREEFPSGWLALTKNESVTRMIDALLDLPSHREFNQSELARMADVSRQSVNRHLDLLLEAEIIEEVEHSSPQRYRFNPGSEVSEAIIKLDGAMNAVGPKASA